MDNLNPTSGADAPAAASSAAFEDLAKASLAINQITAETLGADLADRVEASTVALEQAHADVHDAAVEAQREPETAAEQGIEASREASTAAGQHESSDTQVHLISDEVLREISRRFDELEKRMSEAEAKLVHHGIRGPQS